MVADRESGASFSSQLSTKSMVGIQQGEEAQEEKQQQQQQQKSLFSILSTTPTTAAAAATYNTSNDSSLTTTQVNPGPVDSISTNNAVNNSGSPSSMNKFTTKYPPLALKVLIVDDNVINQKVLDRILKRLGVTDITIVDNGKKAVNISAAAATTAKFDCIFMDMEMPVMGGLEACKLIVDRDKDAARVVFVTAHDIGDIKEKADAAGAFDYISKPLKMQEIHEFLKTVECVKNNTTQMQPAQMEDTEETTMTTTTMATTIATTVTTAIAMAMATTKRATPPKKKRCTKTYPPRELKILVAEDNIINQKVLDRILKRVGVTDITIVDNGEKAVDASATTNFDCILMDMQMPVMDGLEACKIIVKRDRDKDKEYYDGGGGGDDRDCDRRPSSPKIVFVTAHALVEFKEKALASGAFDFITKPFKMEDIDNILTTMEEIKKKETSNTTNASSSSPPPVKPQQQEQPESKPSSLSATTRSSPASFQVPADDESTTTDKPFKMQKLVHTK